MSPPSSAKPWVPAKDFAGVIVSLGEGVKDWRVGDEVHGMQVAPYDGESRWSSFDPYQPPPLARLANGVPCGRRRWRLIW